MEYVVFCSGGNDSIALVQWLYNQGKTDIVVAYNNTGWASEVWPMRMQRVKLWVEGLGYAFVELPSEGMEALAIRKKGWPAPMPGMQFCTQELKLKPSLAWLDVIDPEKEAVCCVGVRREESQKRSTFPEYTEHSDAHGGRALWAPLVRHTKQERNVLLSMAPFPPLPHGSRECFPCIYANRSDVAALPEERIQQIKQLEVSLGHTKKGHLRTFFRPHRKQGAIGIEEAVKWAHSKRGEYRYEGECDSGMCGG